MTDLSSRVVDILNDLEWNYFDEYRRKYNRSGNDPDANAHSKIIMLHKHGVMLTSVNSGITVIGSWKVFDEDKLFRTIMEHDGVKYYPDDL